MNNEQSLNLLKKLISSTSQGSIFWKKYSSSSVPLKPLPKSPLNDAINASLESSASILFEPSISSEDSYVSKMNDGFFFLLLYRSISGDTNIVLRVQTVSSENSLTYASSDLNDSNVEISAQIKRLYNLVNESFHTKDIGQFVERFIKS